MKRTCALAVILSVSAAAASAAELLPDVSLRLSGARYMPSEISMDWDAWIGAGIGVVRVGATTAYVSGDVETILGGERRSFEANQSAYHLEAGGRRDYDWGSAGVFFHHVSRHALDREMVPTVSWNDLGVRVRRSLQVFGQPIRVSATVGIDVAERNTGYRGDGRFGLDGALLRRGDLEGYWSAEAQLVRAVSNEYFDRSGFVDLALEAGARVRRHGRWASVFVAYERRNDTLLLVESRRSRALAGLRFTVVTPDIDGRRTAD